ncbi:FMN-binding negative transcriptional regulator [Henriciella barbarensis]|uniref:FMN-binding negative transcriptional regulator n=1 Tax=Henriciella barbarensis TaxID=86342 RepID=A0A399QWS9_9PROT|nr:FMN-binding negative transcriptional regulator [Henriciella barbarensis]RIJ23360.1 FMN-binding negative transcriptional regulator [Henriciella barbarensis]
MHPAPAYLETDRAILLQRVHDWPFALVIGLNEGRPCAAHTPVLAGPDGTLRFHLSKANPAAKGLTNDRHALIVFSGPHDYISPDWYGMEKQVPTWNYLSVEAEGPVSICDEQDAEQFLEDLSARFEAGLAPKPAWMVASMDRVQLKRMLAAIVTFTLTPQRLEGITKFGQDKPDEARIRAGRALKAAGGDITISTMMERR